MSPGAGGLAGGLAFAVAAFCDAPEDACAVGGALAAGVALVISGGVAAEGFDPTATPLLPLLPEGGTSTICGSSSKPDDCVWLLVCPGAVLGGAGWAACGTGTPGVLPCSGRFGS